MDTPHDVFRAPVPFVNREAELAVLNEAWVDGPSGRPTVILIQGPAGAGKTGLVLHWANSMRQHFPDGCLFRDLRGYDVAEAPVRPELVLEEWLLRLGGLSGTELPPDGDGRHLRFSRLVAGRRLLMVLDNATGAEQVRLLIPAGGSAVVVVTSRDALAGLAADGARVITTDFLDQEHAETLLRDLVGDRTDHDPAAAGRLVSYCAGSPLAVRAVAGRLLVEPELSVRGLEAQLADERGRLRQLADPDDPRIDISAVIATSYRALSDGERQVLDVFGILPSEAGLDSYVASVLAGVDPARAAGLLRQLRRRHLVENLLGRYRVHDLVRLYVAAFGRVDRDVAADRLVTAFHGCVNHAFDLMNTGNPMVDAEYLERWRRGDPDGVAAVEAAASPSVWFDLERSNLVAAVRLACEVGRIPKLAARYACSLFYLLELGGHFDEWAEVESLAERALRVHPNRRDEARSLRNRGRLALVRVLDEQESLASDPAAVATGPVSCAEAVTLLERGRDLYHAEFAEYGHPVDRAGYATTLRELADALRIEAGGSPTSAAVAAAVAAYRAAEQVYRELGNDNAVASLELGLGIARSLSGDVVEAERLFRSSLAFAAPIQDGGPPRHSRLMAFSLRRLGDLRRGLGDRTAAIDLYGRGAAVLETWVPHDRVARGRALARQGITMIEHLRSGASTPTAADARAVLEQAVDLLAGHEREVAVAEAWLAEAMTAGSAGPVDESRHQARRADDGAGERRFGDGEVGVDRGPVPPGEVTHP